MRKKTASVARSKNLASFAFVSQRSRTKVASLVLLPGRDGTVSYQRYQVTTLPNTFPLLPRPRW